MDWTSAWVSLVPPIAPMAARSAPSMTRVNSAAALPIPAAGPAVAGAGAALVGTVELLAVPGIRARAASWAHGIAGMTLVAIAGANWGLRLADPQAVLPQGLALSVVGVLTTAIAGWHGGKLIFDHGIGLMVSPKD